MYLPSYSDMGTTTPATATTPPVGTTASVAPGKGSYVMPLAAYGTAPATAGATATSSSQFPVKVSNAYPVKTSSSPQLSTYATTPPPPSSSATFPSAFGAYSVVQPPSNSLPPVAANPIAVAAPPPEGSGYLTLPLPSAGAYVSQAPTAVAGLESSASGGYLSLPLPSAGAYVAPGPTAAPGFDSSASGGYLTLPLPPGGAYVAPAPTAVAATASPGEGPPVSTLPMSVKPPAYALGPGSMSPTGAAGGYSFSTAGGYSLGAYNFASGAPPASMPPAFSQSAYLSPKAQSGGPGGDYVFLNFDGSAMGSPGAAAKPKYTFNPVAAGSGYGY